MKPFNAESFFQSIIEAIRVRQEAIAELDGIEKKPDKFLKNQVLAGFEYTHAHTVLGRIESNTQVLIKMAQAFQALSPQEQRDIRDILVLDRSVMGGDKAAVFDILDNNPSALLDPMQRYGDVNHFLLGLKEAARDPHHEATKKEWRIAAMLFTAISEAKNMDGTCSVFKRPASMTNTKTATFEIYMDPDHPAKRLVEHALHCHDAAILEAYEGDGPYVITVDQASVLENQLSKLIKPRNATILPGKTSLQQR